MMTRVRSVVVVAAIAVTLASAGPALAGPADPALSAFSHLFALSTATTTRLSGMGGILTCINDDGFANPAFAGTLTDYHSVDRYSATHFDAGLKLKGEQSSIAIPLKDGKRGLQITGFRLKSDPAPPLGVIGAPAIGWDEWDLALHYGQWVSDAWLIGVGLSPTFHNSTDFRLPPFGQVAHFRTTADEGYRLGALHKLRAGGWLGVVYDKYHEDLTGFDPSGPRKERLSSEEIAIGISRPLNERVLAAVEWQQLTTKFDSTKVGDSGFRCGIEALMDTNWTARLGNNDGAFSMGLGYSDTNWTAQYAFIKNWNDDNVRPIFGGSKTHQAEFTYVW